ENDHRLTEDLDPEGHEEHVPELVDRGVDVTQQEYVAVLAMKRAVGEPGQERDESKFRPARWVDCIGARLSLFGRGWLGGHGIMTRFVGCSLRFGAREERRPDVAPRDRSQYCLRQY